MDQQARDDFDRMNPIAEPAAPTPKPGAPARTEHTTPDADLWHWGHRRDDTQCDCIMCLTGEARAARLSAPADLADLAALLEACQAWAENGRPNEDLLAHWPADARNLYLAIRKVLP